MRFAIAFQSDKSPAEYREIAAAVDTYLFDTVSVYNDLLFQPALGPLLWMAPELKRARNIGFAALNPYTLHPVEIAGQVALLDMATSGRAYLGLARGAWLEQVGVLQPKPAQTLREAAICVRRLLAGDTGEFLGKVFHLRDGTKLNYSPIRPRVPIMIGTWGSHTAQMAGELADEIKIGGSANPAMVAVLAPHLRNGEKKAGRVGEPVGVCFGAVTVIDEDRAAAREKVRREAALYLPIVAALDPTLDDPEWLKRVQALSTVKDYEAIGRLISDELLEKFAFAGNAQDVIRQTEKLIDAGATRVEYGTPHGLCNPLDGIKLLGEKVLPHFVSM